MEDPSADRLAAAEQQATDRLRDLKRQVALSNDQLYQHLALYLQVLREGLLPIAQQTCFALVRDTSPRAYTDLSAEERAQFQQRLRQLVARCSCLLTVEQLVSLAAQLQRKERQQRHDRSRQLLESLQSEASSSEASSSEAAADGPRSALLHPHPQSIQLGFELPLSADLFTQGLPLLAGLGSLPLHPQSPETLPAREGAQELQPPEPPQEGPVGGQALGGIEALLALALEDPAADPHPDPDAEGALDGLLPRNPEAVLQWWDQLEQALAHRLRNLSHALNGLLVRSSLNRVLLPIALLESVIHGQIEALPAPANLVRLPFPLPLPPTATTEAVSTVIGVLLRPRDLEYEWPRLRTCRQRLDQHRRQLRRMAQHHRDWQRRRRSIQAQRLWETDVNASSNPPPQGD